MKTALLRARYVLASSAILGLYVLLNYDWLERHFKLTEMVIVFSGLVAVILASSVIVEGCTLTIKTAWAVFAPVAGSVCGYALIALYYLYSKGSPGFPSDIRFVYWLFIAIAVPFTLGRVWTISLMLMMFSGLDYAYSRYRNRKST